MKKTLLTLLPALVLGCAALDDITPLGRSRAEISKGSSYGRKSPGDTSAAEGGGTRADTTVYLAGVEFQRDYDWQRDSAYGNVPCSLVLFRGEERVLSVPAGPGTLFSADPDMHRVVGGHLYTDYSTFSETIVSCDGKEIFRYGGREMIRGFVVRRDTVYTLGQSRSGTGLSLRADGKLLFASEAGTVLGGMYDALCPTGALYEDKGRLCFVYYAMRTGAEHGSRRWYGVTDGIATELDPPLDEVLDIRYLGGEPAYAGVSGSVPLVLHHGGQRVPLRTDPVDKVHYVRLLSVDGDLYLKAEITPRGTTAPRRMLYWKDGRRLDPGGSDRVTDFYMGERIGYITADRSGRVTLLYDGLRRVVPEGNYRMMGGRCALMCGGGLHAALSPRDTSSRAVWFSPAGEKALALNGYLSAIEIITRP